MKKVAVICLNGFEDSEFLLTVDIFRRAQFECDILSVDAYEVESKQQVWVKANKMIDDELIAYDLVVFPGGDYTLLSTAQNEKLTRFLTNLHTQSKYLGFISNSCTTLDLSFLKEIKIEYEGLLNQIKNIILSKGNAATYAFAYHCVDLLGIDSKPIKDRMVYFNAFNAE